MQYNRYLIPTLIFFSLAAGYCITELQKRSAKVRFTANISLVLFAVLFIALNRFTTSMTTPVAFGLMSEEVYLSRYLDQYPICRWINAHLPRDARLITYGEPRGFYLDRDYLWGDPGHHTLIPYESIRSFQDLRAHWRRLGVSHVLINQTHFPLRQSSGLPSLIRQGIETGNLHILSETHGGRFLILEVQ